MREGGREEVEGEEGRDHSGGMRGVTLHYHTLTAERAACGGETRSSGSPTLPLSLERTGATHVTVGESHAPC